MLKLWLKSFILATAYYYSSALASDVGFNDDLYQKILTEFQNKYHAIGTNEAQKIFDSNGIDINQGLNSIGFSYRKPFVDFSFEINRNLAPDLFSDTRWIVTDTLLVEVEATKLLNRLKNENQIDITESNLAMYAGITFKRKFTWVHFSDSYQNGLVGSLEKLFFPFLNYNSKYLSKMPDNELLTKEDFIGFQAGGLATIPIYHGISATAGLLTNLQKISKSEIYISQKIENGERDVHISNESSKVFSNDINLSLVASFLKVIKFSLLSYDFNYERNESHRVFLVIPQSYLQSHVEEKNENELSSILSNKKINLNSLDLFKVSEEEKLSLALTHKYNFLLMGGMKSAQTEQVTISDKLKSVTYFRHFFEKIKYIENPWSKFVGSILYSLTNTHSSLVDLSNEIRKVSIEYASRKNLIQTREDLKLASEQVLSLRFDFEFSAKSDSSLLAKRAKMRNLFYLEHLSELPSEISSWVNNNELSTPSNFKSQFLVQQLGVNYLNNLQVSFVFDQFNSMCSTYPKTSFFNFRNLFDHCNYILQSDFINYFQNLKHDKVTITAIEQCEKKSIKYIFNPSKRRNYIKSCIDITTYKDSKTYDSIPLWELKTLLSSIVSTANDKVSFYNLFGVNNVFHFGNLTAKTISQKDFTVSYHAGLFQNLGVIDDFMRTNNLRSPTSIYLGQ